MKVSVVIPTFNRSEYLRGAIESALMQDYEDLEIIVCDNASNDNTPDVVDAYLGDARIRYFRNQENIGMVNNWKLALDSYVSGDWFLILSDDDYFIDNQYISKAVGLASSEQNIVMVYSNGYIDNVVTGERKVLNLPFSGVIDGERIFVTRGKIEPQDFTLCNILFNTRAAKELKPFSNPLNVSCDSELFLRLCLRGRVGVLDCYSTVYRIHGDNLLAKVKSDFDLLINNLDFIISPYIDVLVSDKLTISERTWFEESCVLRLLRAFLLTTVTMHREKIREAENKVLSMPNGIGSRLLSMQNHSFYLRYLIRKHMFWAYSMVRRARGKH